VKEVAARWNVCAATVYSLIEAGRIWTVRIQRSIRIPFAAVAAAKGSWSVASASGKYFSMAARRRAACSELVVPLETRFRFHLIQDLFAPAKLVEVRRSRSQKRVAKSEREEST
jgi:excisionase family DNA binding protein